MKAVATLRKQLNNDKVNNKSSDSLILIKA